MECFAGGTQSPGDPIDTSQSSNSSGSPVSEPKDTSVNETEKSNQFMAMTAAQPCSPFHRAVTLCQLGGDTAGRTGCPCPPPVCQTSHLLPGEQGQPIETNTTEWSQGNFSWVKRKQLKIRLEDCTLCFQD